MFDQEHDQSFLLGARTPPVDLYPLLASDLLGGLYGTPRMLLTADTSTQDPDTGLLTLTDRTGGGFDASQPAGQTPIAAPQRSARYNGRHVAEISPGGESPQYLSVPAGLFAGGSPYMFAYSVLNLNQSQAIFRAGSGGNLGVQTYNGNARAWHRGVDVNANERAVAEVGNVQTSPHVGIVCYDPAGDLEHAEDPASTMTLDVYRRRRDDLGNQVVRFTDEAAVEAPVDSAMRVFSEGGAESAQQGAGFVRLMAMTDAVPTGAYYRRLRSGLANDAGIPLR